jgi:GH25 family lysozyme M1 (1,4-beta-N-acetylmuramidase)
MPPGIPGHYRRLRRTSLRQPRRGSAWVMALVLAAGSLAGPMSGTAAASPDSRQATVSPSASSAPGNVAAPAFSESQCGHRTAPLCGFDVDASQSVNWGAEKNAGARFTYIKATEGTYYVNPDFASQARGAHNAGLYHGAYTFAIPSVSSGAAQAKYLVSHGGGWSAAGGTLPGALDIEFNPYGSKNGLNECYGMTQGSMRSWIGSFVTTYHSLTKRWPIVYTNENWWRACVGTSENWDATARFGDPLWISCWCSSSGSLPLGYKTFSFWQLAEGGKFPGDQDVWNGTTATLGAFSHG